MDKKNLWGFCWGEPVWSCKLPGWPTKICARVQLNLTGKQNYFRGAILDEFVQCESC